MVTKKKKKIKEKCQNERTSKREVAKNTENEQIKVNQSNQRWDRV